MAIALNRDEVIARAARLPAFPRVVTDILAALDDDNTTIRAVVQHVERDPVITARVLSLANSAALHAHAGPAIRDIATATSMIGIAKLREIVVAISLAEFVRDSRMSTYFWEHSVAVGIAAQSLAKHTRASTDYALVAGLLHDIGQLWMAKFYPREFQQVRLLVAGGNGRIDDVERDFFGLDHCDVGLIIAEHWGLPAAVAKAIRHHHQPDAGLDEELVAVTHVAEVLANALDLTQREDNQVTGLSSAACAMVGIDWQQDLRTLFGKIEARSAYACAVFR